MRILLGAACILVISGSFVSCSKSDGAIAAGTDAFVQFTVDGQKYTHLSTYATYRDETLIITSNALLNPHESYTFALRAKILDNGTYFLEGDNRAENSQFLSLSDITGQGQFVTHDGYTVELRITRIIKEKKEIAGYFSGDLIEEANGLFHPQSTLKIEDGSFIVYYF